MKKSYYADTCIYLNLWQKEIDDNGNPLWRYAKEFFEKTEDENSIIYYSGFLLKELKFILTPEEFNNKKELFETSLSFKRAFLSSEEYNEARKVESETNYEISFYDIIHMLLARKTKSILITRDYKLIKIAERYSVEVKRPEEIL